MILDSLQLRGRYAQFPQIHEALEALSKALAGDFPAERIVVDGDRLYINPISLTTVFIDAPVFETHRRYLDVHCLVSGEEKILVQRADLLTPSKPYDKEKDYALFEGSAGASVTLFPGDFLVCFPEDAHAPGLSVKEPQAVRKFVAKVLL